MEETEIWKDIPGYEGLYQVSDLGNVRSLGRAVVRRNGSIDNKQSKVLKQSDNGKGYKNVKLSDKDAKVKSHYVHRLVVITFLGYEDTVVDHKDKNRGNNKLSNLRYLSPRDNTSNNKINRVSKYTGLSQDNRSNKWRAFLKIQGGSYYVGTFISEEEASQAYKNAVYNWTHFNMTPKGEYLNDKDHKIFSGENRIAKKKNNKIVLDLTTGIFYDSLKEASRSLYPNNCYKYISQMVSGSRPNKTNLIYV